MKLHKRTLLVLLGLLTTVSATHGTPVCTTEALQTASHQTSRVSYLSQVKDLTESGTATNEKVDAIKEQWLEQKKEALGDLEQLISVCERQAKKAEDPLEAAHFLAVAFEARLSRDLAAPGNQRRNILSDAVASLSSVDRHDQSGVVLPFLARSAEAEWDRDPDTAHHLIERALDIAERNHGQASIERAELAARFASLFALYPNNPQADPARAEALFTEALVVYQDHPAAQNSESYRRLLSAAREFSLSKGKTASPLSQLIE